MIRSILYKLNFLRFRKIIKKNNSIFFIDFDNTLANTAKSRIQGTHKDIASLEPMIGTIAFIKERLKEGQQPVVLSARDIKTYFQVQKWLGVNLGIELVPLFMVNNANKKLDYYQLCSDSEVVYEVIDDCSYNHENGEVKFYDKLITYLKEKNVPYFNYEYIIKLNK
ncbi:MAG: hypothetical protein COA58_01645 [Bacteroidetes bacterium]|nr:MAG: hypothetical protein COA58_01645 [Bacteroidota bacterium]